MLRDLGQTSTIMPAIMAKIPERAIVYKTILEPPCIAKAKGFN